MCGAGAGAFSELCVCVTQGRDRLSRSGVVWHASPGPGQVMEHRGGRAFGVVCVEGRAARGGAKYEPTRSGAAGNVPGRPPLSSGHRRRRQTKDHLSIKRRAVGRGSLETAGKKKGRAGQALRSRVAVMEQAVHHHHHPLSLSLIPLGHVAVGPPRHARRSAAVHARSTIRGVKAVQASSPRERPGASRTPSAAASGARHPEQQTRSLAPTTGGMDERRAPREGPHACGSTQAACGGLETGTQTTLRKARRPPAANAALRSAPRRRQGGWRRARCRGGRA